MRILRFGSRVVHAVMALAWCGMVAARPMAVPCPMGGHGEHGHAEHSQFEHSQSESPHVGSPHAESLHAEMGHSSTHTGPATDVVADVSTETSSDTPSNSPTSHPCDCLGHCCATDSFAPSTFPTTVAVTERQLSDTHFAPRDAYVSTWADFVLPFAHGPPARTNS